jgi:regulatory protein
MSVTITKIEAQKKRKQRFSLFAGDIFLLGVSFETLSRFHISTGMKVSGDQLQRIENAETAFQLREQAFRLLARRAHSRRELRDKLKQRNYDPGLIEELLDDLSNRKYLDDRQFAEAFLREELRIHFSGPALIRDKLRQKGIDGETIDVLLKKNCPPAQQLKNCQHLAGKKIKSWPRPLGRNQITRLGTYLRNKGFNWEIIRQAIGGFIEEDFYGGE